MPTVTYNAATQNYAGSQWILPARILGAPDGLSTSVVGLADGFTFSDDIPLTWATQNAAWALRTVSQIEILLRASVTGGGYFRLRLGTAPWLADVATVYPAFANNPISTDSILTINTSGSPTILQFMSASNLFGSIEAQTDDSGFSQDFFVDSMLVRITFADPVAGGTANARRRRARRADAMELL